MRSSFLVFFLDHKNDTLYFFTRMGIQMSVSDFGDGHQYGFIQYKEPPNFNAGTPVITLHVSLLSLTWIFQQRRKRSEPVAIPFVVFF
jgi:hypothetical protein